MFTPSIALLLCVTLAAGVDKAGDVELNIEAVAKLVTRAMMLGNAGDE